MAANSIYFPFINPVKFYEVGASSLEKYQTAHFDDHLFSNRILPWQSQEGYEQIWQDTDIIKLQFESTFDPIIVSLIDENLNAVIQLPALVGLPNKFLANTFSFEIAMSLAGIQTGCYQLKVTAGSGLTQKVFISGSQFISSEPIFNSLCLEYFNSRYHEDVVFETGIQFQFRVYGHLGFLDPGRKDEMYRDERYNPALLNSRTLRQFPVTFGNERGLPDDIIDLLNRIWSCDNVMIDNKSFGIADGSKFEFVGEEGYPMRGVKLTVEEGINRNSKVFTLNTDPNKKIITTIIVDAKVFGDTSNQGSNNTVPVYNISE